jgi:hypothetical protein
MKTLMFFSLMISGFQCRSSHIDIAWRNVKLTAVS